MELRPGLTTEPDALAFGFTGERIPAAAAVTTLSALIDHVEQSATASSPRLVVVDMRNVETLSTAALGKLIAVNQRLSKVRWRLLLVIDDPVVREVVAATGLDQFVSMTSSDELAKAARNGQKADFTESELAEMISSGLTLDDAIREIERLRE
jgi:anti-anti-sigma factor